MSFAPTEVDQAYARGIRAGFKSASRLRWYEFPGNCPPDIPGQHDSRCLCWIVTPDGMAYIGLRAFQNGEWVSNNRPESGTVTHWMPLPEPPWVIGTSVLQKDDLPFTRASDPTPAATDPPPAPIPSGTPQA